MVAALVVTAGMAVAALVIFACVASAQLRDLPGPTKTGDDD